MRYPKPETVNKRLVENPKLTQRVRVSALEAVTEPSLALLLRLLKDPRTPARLMELAAQKYQAAILSRTLAELPESEKRNRLHQIICDQSKSSSERKEASRLLKALPDAEDEISNSLLGIRSHRRDFGVQVPHESRP